MDLNLKFKRIINLKYWVEIFSGVLQGSVIGKLLFVLYINDLPNEIENVVKMHADDTKIFSQTISEINSTKLQLDLFFKWTQDWLLLFNTSKCVVMHYDHKIFLILSTVNSNQLQKPKEILDLFENQI